MCCMDVMCYIIIMRYLETLSGSDFNFLLLITTLTIISSSNTRDVTTTTGIAIAAIIPPFRADKSPGVGVTARGVAVLSTVELFSMNPSRSKTHVLMIQWHHYPTIYSCIYM